MGDNNLGKEDNDLQRAIALSLEQQSKGAAVGGGGENNRSDEDTMGESSMGGGAKRVTWGDMRISNEDTDINKALEESLRTSKLENASLYAFDGDPNERKRCSSEWPLGLQNIGNSCWFNSVIQALFNISAFRNLVLNFNPPLNAAPTESAKKKFQFMKELRTLFAYLIGSSRKYVNPRRSVEIFKGAFEGSAYSNTQQDVTEFTSKLLEWVEESLQIYNSALEQSSQLNSIEKEDQSTTSLFSDNSAEEMVSPDQLKGIFYGEIETHGLTDRNEEFQAKEAFIQVPLQVRGFQTLYDSIDASLQSEFTASSSRGEQWITKVPRVVILNLNRFIYNPSSQRTEKIHDRLQFPEVLYLDRFLLRNQKVTREKRKRVGELKAKLNVLNSQLNHLQEFGSKAIPLKDGLQCVLDYASTLDRSAHADDRSLSNYKTTGDSHLTYSSLQSEEMRSPGKNSSSSLCDDMQIDLQDDFTSSDNTLSTVASSDASDIRSDSVKTVISTLTMWKSKVARQIQDLQASIQELTNQIDAMYNQDSLKTMPYKLHAVLVHEGEALSGHYWCFVKQRVSDYSNAQTPAWLKFNDTQVSWADKSHMQTESFGGGSGRVGGSDSGTQKGCRQLSCSAYCLIYIDTASNDIFEETGNVCLESLPEDLRQTVREDNESFEKELASWNSNSKLQESVDLATLDEGGGAKYSTRNASFAVAERDSIAEHGRDEHSESSHAAENVGLNQTNKEYGLVPSQTLTSSPRDNADVSLDQLNERVCKLMFDLSSMEAKQLVQKVSAQFDSSLEGNAYAKVSKLLTLLKKEMDERLNRADEDGDAECPTVKGAVSRLRHIAYLAISLSLNSLVINRCNLETLTYIDRSCLSDDTVALQNAATRFLEKWTWPPDAEAYVQYCQLHRDFFQLFRAASRFSDAFLHFQEGRHRAAMPQFINALEINSQGEYDPGKRLDAELLCYFRRVCFINLNQEALDQFQSEDLSEQMEGLRLAQEFVIPVAGSLCKSAVISSAAGNSQETSTSQNVVENLQAVEYVRAQWFSLLANEIAPSLVEKFQDVLSKLTDESSLTDLAFQVDYSILNKFDTDLERRSVEQIVKTVSEAVAYKSSRSDTIMEVQ